MEETQNKKQNKSLIIVIVLLVIILVGLFGAGYYGYKEYQNLKNDNEKLEAKFNDLNKELEKSKVENEGLKSQDNNISDNQNTNNDISSQNNNYQIEGNKHIYSSEANSSIYAINSVMYLSSYNGNKKLDINESDVNMAVVKESAQGTLGYVVKKDGSVIRYYDGFEFNKKNVFNNYKVKNLTINCIAGDDGACSSKTYTLNLLDGTSKTVNSDE